MRTKQTALAVAALLAGAAVAWLDTKPGAPYRTPSAPLGLFVGWSFIGSGLAAYRGRPDNPLGRVMMFMTATERRVAQLALAGMTNRQIAETLFITRKTVERHLEHIFRKLGIHARGELGPALAPEDELTAVR